LGRAGARLVAWKRRHPWLAAGGLVVLLALLGWAGYQGIWYWRGRSQYRAAQLAVDRHDWAAANEHLKVALRDWPRSTDSRLLAARVARRRDRFDDAEEHLDACQQLEGRETQAIKVERSLIRVHQGDLAGQEEFLRTCVKQDDPDSAEILDILSIALIIDYRMAEAQRYLDDLLQRRPNDFDALVHRGQTAESMGWYADAVQHYEKALALRPEVDSVRLAMAEILVALGRFADAQPHFEQLGKRQPQNPSVRFGLARCLAGSGQKEQGLRMLDKLLAENPTDWKMLSERGWLLVQLDRAAEGETDLRKAHELAPFDLPLLTHLADCLRLAGKEDEASKYRDKAIHLQADIQRAAELGDLIREKKPDDPDLRCELGCVLLRLGKKQDAEHWFQTALKKNPTHRKAHESLVELYKSVNALDLADHHQRVLQGLDSTKGGASH
jgi:tetratricopeptide (TPR) repeat protein